jgi:diaminopropionate ammonia-lyase
MCEFSFNTLQYALAERGDLPLSVMYNDDVRSFHRSLEGYDPTPLISLKGLAKRLDVKELLVKDESRRFDLKAFKVLGASYAMYRFMKKRWEAATGVILEPPELFSNAVSDTIGRLTFCTATDGNHGRAVAWMANKLRQAAVIYMPANSAEARVKAIRSEGARVVLIDESYDEVVAQAAADAEAMGWEVISDTSYAGYTEIPVWIMNGYKTLFEEIDEAMPGSPLGHNDLVFVQAGVGALAAAAAWHYRFRGSSDGPRLICVEPNSAACLLASWRSGGEDIQSVAFEEDTIMAGLNCGTPSLVAWPFIRAGFDVFMSVSDHYAIRAMKHCHDPEPGDSQIVSGESGAAGLAALLALTADPVLLEARLQLNIGPHSRVLLLNTEGDTDPVGYERAVDLAQ